MNSVKDKKTLKHQVLEILEGGLRGNTAARVLAWVLIVLILCSILFLFLAKSERFEKWEKAFEIVEAVTVAIFTLELILGFWTADIRFPDHPHPHLRYLTDFMTIVQILAILPFYLGLLLHNTRYMEYAEFFELLKLLHLLKIGEIVKHAVKAVRKEKSSKGDSSLRSE